MRLRFLILAFLPAILFGQTEWEYYKPTCNSYRAVYGANYRAGEQFTIGTIGENAEHRTYSVTFLMARGGSPGTSYIYISELDGSGYPTGTPVASASFDGDALGTTLHGDTVEAIVSADAFDAQPSTQYGAWVSAPNGDVSNYLVVSRISSDGYAGGYGLYSDESGWATDPGDDYDHYFIIKYLDVTDPGPTYKDGKLGTKRLDNIITYFNKPVSSGTTPPLAGGEFLQHNWNDAIINDLAHDMDFVTYQGASVGEKVGTFKWNMNRDTISSIVYSIVTDTSGLFDSDADSLYFSSVTGLQYATTYHLQFKVTDGSISDTANCYVYVAANADTINWDDQYSSLTTDKFYCFQRGSTYSLTDEITVDANNVWFIAIGGGDAPILKPTGTAGSMFVLDYNNDGTLISGLEFQRDGNTSVWQVVNFDSEVDNFTFMNNRVIGSDDSYWYNAFWHVITMVNLTGRSENHKYFNNYVTGLFGSVVWTQRTDDYEVIGNFHRDLGLGEPDGDPSGVGGISNGWDCEDGVNYCTEVDVRYNRIDHSSQPYKYGIQVGGYGLNVMTYDTIQQNYVIGPGTANGDIDYAFNGIATNQNSMVYIAYNRVDSCERGFAVTSGYVKHVKWINNLVVNARQLGYFIFTGTEVDSSYVLHNTFIDPNDADPETWYVFGGDWTAEDTIANNIIDVNDGQNIFQDLDATRRYNIYTDLTGTGYTKTATEIEDDPELVNKSGGDYHIGTSGPAYEAGEDYDIEYDYEGDTRNGTTPSIGAFEDNN